MMQRTIGAFLALTAASILSAEPAPTSPRPTADSQTIDKTSQAEDVRFRTEAADRMTVSVHLSGIGPYRFLVDTGADRTAISRELATKLRLVPADSAVLHSIAGVSTVATATVPDLQFSRKSVTIDRAPLLESRNMGADGIIGTDSLGKQRVEFDFIGQTMAIMPSAAPDIANEPGSIVIEARRRNGRLIVTDATANGQHLTVVVDTGSQVSIGNSALKRQLRSRALIESPQPVELMSVTGQEIAGEYAPLTELEIGGVTLHNLMVVFADAHTFKQLHLDNEPALLLGMNAMRAFKKVSIDFARRRFRVVLPQRSEVDVRLASAAE
jgi:predicted aspartyl protease